MKVAVYGGGFFFELFQQKAPARPPEATPITHMYSCVILSPEAGLAGASLGQARRGVFGLLNSVNKSGLACCID